MIVAALVGVVVIGGIRRIGEVAERDLLARDTLPVQGRWPQELAGTFYRNGPAGHETGGQRYHHWFDGDGMVQAFDISSGEIRHRGRFVETAKRRAELDAGHMLWPAFGTPLAGGLPVARPDTINTANISLLHHAGELLALWGVALRIALPRSPSRRWGRTRGAPTCAAHS